MIQQEVQDQMKIAMKSGDTAKRDYLRFVMGEFTRVNKEISDKESLKIIKSLNDKAIEMGNDYEVSVLDQWMPTKIDTFQLRTLISGIITACNFSGMRDMGKVMIELKNLSMSDGIDMKEANVIVKELLNR